MKEYLENKNVAQAEDIPKDIIQAHNSVWEMKPCGGTAFFIGPNQVVTHFHVIMGVAEGYKNRSVEDMYLEQGDKKLKLSKVLYASAVAGLVILETEEGVSEYLNVSKEKPSGSLFALGYPQRVKGTLKRVKQTLIHSGEYEIIDNDHSYEMEVDKTILGGMSGGPVLDGQKKVVGVVNYSNYNILNVIKLSKLEELQRGLIGLNCSKLSLSFCIEQAIKNLKEKAEQGDPLAQNNLSMKYYYGTGMEQDKEKAFEWVLQSAKQGFAPAQHAVAVMHLKGTGVEQDKEKAFEWMLQSAKQGNAPAQHTIAQMYLKGEGVEQNKEKTTKWMLKSKEQGFAPAQKAVEGMHL